MRAGADDPRHRLGCRQVADRRRPVPRARRGAGSAVRPFKPQNMSNNAAVTADGGEIGRAQALQARACGVAPSTDMNPVLLKPQSEHGAQVVRRRHASPAPRRPREYHALKPELLPRVLESFDALVARGRSSCWSRAPAAPAEINLRAGDIANMGFAAAARRAGGAGRRHRARRRHRRARRHARAARSGRARAARRLHRQQIPRRPAALRQRARRDRGAHRHARASASCRGSPRRAICRPRIAWRSIGAAPRRARDGAITHRRAAPAAHRQFRRSRSARAPSPTSRSISSRRAGRCRRADLVLLPGSKATLADLAALRARGLGHRYPGPCAPRRRSAGHLRRLSDAGPPHRRSRTASRARRATARGLGLLDVETVLAGEKIARERARHRDRERRGASRGYEMHVGPHRQGPARRGRCCGSMRQDDGAVSPRRPRRRLPSARAFRRR